jgi:hypothetical protein
MSSKPTAKLALKHNKKLDKIYDPITGLVFKSPNEKLVTGRIVDNEFRPLDEEILALCEEHGFKHDESLIEVAEEGDAPTTETEEEPQEVASPAPAPVVAPVVVPVSLPTPAPVSTPAVPPVSLYTLQGNQFEHHG